jgi:hypothetical protein
MKLYATTTSNRAKKGQGGDLLDIDILHQVKGENIQAVTVKVRKIGDDTLITATEFDQQGFGIRTVTLFDTRQARIIKATEHSPAYIEGEEKAFSEGLAEFDKDEICNCGASELPDIHSAKDCLNPYKKGKQQKGECIICGTPLKNGKCPLGC